MQTTRSRAAVLDRIVLGTMIAYPAVEAITDVLGIEDIAFSMFFIGSTVCSIAVVLGGIFRNCGAVAFVSRSCSRAHSPTAYGRRIESGLSRKRSSLTGFKAIR